MSVRNVNAMPQSCAGEIDVTWNNDGRAVWMAVDQVMVNGPTNHVFTRTPIANFQQPLRDSTVIQGNTYQYNVFNWDRNLRPINPAGQSNQAFVGGCFFLESTAFIQTYPATFEVLVPRGAAINDYTHEEGSILTGLWKHAHQLALPNAAGIQAGSVNLIQGISGDLEAVARLSPPAGVGSDYLVAYEFASQVGWKGPVNLVSDRGSIDHVSGPTAFIQSTYDNQGHYELLVPRGAVIDHYRHDAGSILEGQWTHVHTLRPPTDDPQAQFKAVVLIQSSSRALEVIARLSPAAKGGAGGDYLVAYELKPISGSAVGTASESGVVTITETVSVVEDAEGISALEEESISVSILEPESRAAPDWQGPLRLVSDSGPIDGVTGSAAIIESNRGEFVMLVPRGTALDQYTHAIGSILERQWRHFFTVASPQPGAQITANWLIESKSGKLEAILRVSPPAGGGDDFLAGIESDPGADWQGPVKLEADDGPILIGKSAGVIQQQV